MNIVRVCRRNRYAVYLLTAFLTLAGIYSFFVLPSNIYPSLDFPRIMILVHSGDLSPRTILLMVTRPLEISVSTVQGMYRVRSKTIRGACQISVLFNPGMDMKYALQLVQTQVSTMRGSLPPETEVAVEWESPTVYPVLSLILNGHVPDADLYDYACPGRGTSKCAGDGHARSLRGGESAKVVVAQALARRHCERIGGDQPGIRGRTPAEGLLPIPNSDRRSIS